MTTPSPSTDPLETTDPTGPATSSPPRPRPRPDPVPDTPQGTSETTSSQPSPIFDGDEVGEPSAGRGHHVVPDTGTTRDDVTPRPAFITPRTRPFWQALHDTLITTPKIPHRDVVKMGQTHGLEPRTVKNLLARVPRRRWISRSAGYVTLRDRAAFEQALLEAGRG